MSLSEIAFLPATAAAGLIRRRELSPVELLEANRAQYEALNPTLNALVTPCWEQAREQARQAEGALRVDQEALSPLHGLTLGIKDLTLTAGLRTTFGSTLYADNVPTEDSLVISRIKAAGGIIVGKTNTPEFGFGMNTRNAVFGTTSNPWNPALTSGGSSGGSAAGLATGMFALADGSDHGGSLRGPAAFCGVVGFRTSPGRVPAYPSSWVYDTFSVPGPMARTVRDLALLLSVMAGPDHRAPLSISEPGAPLAAATEGGIAGWRVAWTPDLDGLLTLDHEVRRVTETAMRRWTELGCTLEQAAPDLSRAVEVIPPLRAMRTAVVRQAQLDRVDQLGNQGLKEYLALAGQLTALDVARAEWGRSQLWQEVDRFFERYDLLLMPTMQMSPFPKDRALPETIGGRPTSEVANASLATYAISITNLPAISVPCGFTTDGLPVGLQIVGGWRREAAVLRAAAAFEDAFPWSQHRPPMVRAAEGL